GIVCARPRYAATSFRSRGTDSDRTTSSRILAGLRPGASQSAPGRRRSDDYFFTPRSASASLALARESACLPLSCRLCASLSLATAPFTLGSFWSIFAAASRPSLITFGHELASATPLVSARLTATAVTVRSFLIRNSPPRDTRGFYQQSTADRLRRFPRRRFRRLGLRSRRRMEVLVDPLRHLRRDLRHGGQLGHRRLASQNQVQNLTSLVMDPLRRS